MERGMSHPAVRLRRPPLNRWGSLLLLSLTPLKLQPASLEGDAFGARSERADTSRTTHHWLSFNIMSGLAPDPAAVCIVQVHI